jgi:hypothetical protein
MQHIESSYTLNLLRDLTHKQEGAHRIDIIFAAIRPKIRFMASLSLRSIMEIEIQEVFYNLLVGHGERLDTIVSEEQIAHAHHSQQGLTSEPVPSMVLA